MSAEKRCIDCDAPITDEARALNESELWCVKCEKERRARITASFDAIKKGFESRKSDA